MHINFSSPFISSSLHRLWQAEWLRQQGDSGHSQRQRAGNSWRGGGHSRRWSCTTCTTETQTPLCAFAASDLCWRSQSPARHWWDGRSSPAWDAQSETWFQKSRIVKVRLLLHQHVESYWNDALFSLYITKLNLQYIPVKCRFERVSLSTSWHFKTNPTVESKSRLCRPFGKGWQSESLIMRWEG